MRIDDSCRLYLLVYDDRLVVRSVANLGSGNASLAFELLHAGRYVTYVASLAATRSVDDVLQVDFHGCSSADVSDGPTIAGSSPNVV